MTALTTAVVSITATARRRFFWAAWWTSEPSYAPFRKPDAADGGAKTVTEAIAQAERRAGRRLTIIDAYWARAWKRMLRGEAVAPPPEKPRAAPAARGEPASAWSILGLQPGASLLEVRRAFHQKALETHPDQGGDATRFREVLRAFERLTRKRKTQRRAARRKHA